MEGITLVKVSDLKAVLNEVKSVKIKLREMEERNDLKSYSVQQTANLLGMSYNSVRKLIIDGKLSPKYLNDKQEKGKCIIPAWSIKKYLSKN